MSYSDDTIRNQHLPDRLLRDRGATTRRCAVCDGELIGSEHRYGTCGHCGGRSRVPDGGLPDENPDRPGAG